MAQVFCPAGPMPARPGLAGLLRRLEFKYVAGMFAAHLEVEPIPQDGKTFTGAFLMETGLDFEVGGEHASHVLELKAAE
jgi:hypothetical protein